jgi:hypothetical protein
MLTEKDQRMPVQIDCPEQLVHALRAKLPGYGQYSPLPWQRQEPRTTVWWMTPSGRNPAYADAKFFCSLDKDVPRRPLLGIDDSALQLGTLFVGLNIEKGFGSSAYAVAPKPRSDERLTSEWAWQRLVDGDGPEQFTHTLAGLSKSVPTPHLYVISSTRRDPDDRNPRMCDAVLFECTPTGISFRMSNKLLDGSLDAKDVAGATSFGQLAKELRKIDDFHWVDVYAGAYVPKGEVDLLQLHGRILSYFESWVV